jgi:hypothetical protein
MSRIRPITPFTQFEEYLRVWDIDCRQDEEDDEEEDEPKRDRDEDEDWDEEDEDDENGGYSV